MHGVGLASREEVIAHFSNQHNITENQNCNKVMMVLTDFINLSMQSRQDQQTTSLKQQNILVSPPSQEGILEAPPVFLLHFETAPKGPLVWTCLHIWGLENKYMVTFTLSMKRKTSSKLIEGANPRNKTEFKVTSKPIEQHLSLA